jgi:hypothetical protein
MNNAKTRRPATRTIPNFAYVVVDRENNGFIAQFDTRTDAKIAINLVAHLLHAKISRYAIHAIK